MCLKNELHPLLLTRIVIVSMSLLLASYAAMPFQANKGQVYKEEAPLQSIRKLTKAARSAKAGFAFSEAQNVSAELVKPLNLDSSTSASIADYLANEQMAWQSKAKKGIDEEKLIRNLNAQLQLEGTPAYFQMRREQLRRLRVVLWLHAGDLNGGAGASSKRETTVGQSILDPEMSPFEAYAAGGLLLYQKLYNGRYLQTEDEDLRAVYETKEAPLTPGLHVLPANPRTIEFQEHLGKLASSGKLRPESAGQFSRNVLEASRRD